jgi:hypothetical protein
MHNLHYHKHMLMWLMVSLLARVGWVGADLPEVVNSEFPHDPTSPPPLTILAVCKLSILK